MKTELLHDAFHDIAAYGSLRMKKSKLLWMLGRAHETPSAWTLLMREWAAFGERRPLFGLHWGDEITLTMAASENIEAQWTNAREVERNEPAKAPFLPHIVPRSGLERPAREGLAEI
ncbi:hypothetical protein ACP4J4_13875 [Aureimonas ureilytica]|uniref:hypothetical protein n=1 Tax=Aureimonas ureilytica TaxID=401562 RepID=UPI003CEECA0A